MKIVTVFNFPDMKNYNNLCRWWCTQTDKHRCGLPVEIWTKDASSVKCDIPEDFSVLEKESVAIDGVVCSNLFSPKAEHNIGFKLYNVCLESEPFIFVDADAILLADVIPLVEASKDKPYIAVDHQCIPIHTADLPRQDFLNSGLQIVSDPDMLDWERVSKHYRINHYDYFIYPGTDQSIIQTYLEDFEYDHRHPNVGYEWNSCAGYTQIEDGQAVCRGLSTEHPVYINHYWYTYKPWIMRCPLFEEFVNG